MVNTHDQKLKRRFRDFLAFRRTEATAAVRASIREVLDQIQDRGWTAYIVGGTLRDVMLAPPSTFPRDIDLVVVGPSQAVFEDTFHDLLSRRTRFGGLHLIKKFGYGGISTSRGQVVFDIWRLEDTWGIRTAGLPTSIESFVQTPFLNIDSVAIELVPRGSRRQIVESGFFESLETRTLEINYEPNPFPLVCIVRSLIMAAKLNFVIGSALSRYIANYSQAASIDDLIDAQISHYGRVRSKRDEIERWLGEIGASVEAGRERVQVSATYERQLELWKDWPPSATGYPSEQTQNLSRAPSVHRILTIPLES